MFRTTMYFEISVRRRRPNIKDIWIKQALSKPEYIITQPDGRVRHYIYIEEYDRFLRVVIENGAVHNAFLDRGFKPQRQ